jgi:hypothetical protein
MTFNGVCLCSQATSSINLRLLKLPNLSVFNRNTTGICIYPAEALDDQKSTNPNPVECWVEELAEAAIERDEKDVLGGASYAEIIQDSTCHLSRYFLALRQYIILYQPTQAHTHTD